jgi:hypothetical protein
MPAMLDAVLDVGLGVVRHAGILHKQTEVS